MRTILFIVAVVLPTAWASAQEAEPDFRPLIESLVKDHVIPAYRELADRAAHEAGVMAALCANPNPDTMAVAEAGFADLVAAFSEAELYRFGPARVENRFERLFFWPDRRGRGLRQVQGLIAAEDPSAADADALAGKSVAVQGLPAFDYVIAGAGRDGLTDIGGSHRCLYGVAIAERIKTVSEALLDDWRKSGGYADLMLNPGPDNPVYRSEQEVMQEFLRAIGEQLQITRDFKLLRVVGESPEKAKPKRAPFWRSRNWLRSVGGNIQAIHALFAEGRFTDAVPVQQAGLIRQLLFELAQARRAVSETERAGRAPADLLKDSDQHALLHYTTIPLKSAAEIVQGRLPAALGLTIGFNSLDGD